MPVGKGDLVAVAAGRLGMAIRWGGDVTAARHAFRIAKLEAHIRELSPALTTEQRADLIAVLFSSNAA